MKPWFMSPEQFERAVMSLKGYWGVIGVIGGNPTTSRHFSEYCRIMREHVPFVQRGILSNHPLGQGKLMRETFCPRHSNLNCHMDKKAFAEFKIDWPESMPFGAERDSRHSPPWVGLKDVVADEGERWSMISGCDINRNWSAGITLIRGQLRAFFCEQAGYLSSVHEDDPNWPDVGLTVAPDWWRLPMTEFASQVRHCCHRCGIPLRGHGELSQASDGREQVSAVHADFFRPKRPDRRIELVMAREQLGVKLHRATDYVQNGQLA